MARIPLLGRIRFSLRTFLLTLFVLSLIGSNLYVSFKWRMAQTEAQRLRDELGYLTIDDPTRFYVRLSPISGDMIWRWRIYVPPGNFESFIAAGGIPANGTETTGDVGSTIADCGEYTIIARLERTSVGTWKFKLLSRDNEQVTAILPPHNGWLSGKSDFELSMSISTARIKVTGANKTESFAADEPVALLRLRARKQGQAPDENCDGVMVWIQKGGPPPPGVPPSRPPARTFRPR